MYLYILYLETHNGDVSPQNLKCGVTETKRK